MLCGSKGFWAHGDQKPTKIDFLRIPSCFRLVNQILLVLLNLRSRPSCSRLPPFPRSCPTAIYLFLGFGGLRFDQFLVSSLKSLPKHALSSAPLLTKQGALHEDTHQGPMILKACGDLPLRGGSKVFFGGGRWLLFKIECIPSRR